jgi:acyl carrier protein
MSEQIDQRSVVLDALATVVSRAESLDGLHDDTSLVDAGVLDSVAFLELVMALEENTGQTIDFAEMDPEEFTCVSGLVRALGSSN